MAWKKWGYFFNDMGHYFNSETWTPATPPTGFNPYYYFLTNHFCGYTQNQAEIDLRTVYSREGSFAFQQSKLMHEAIKVSNNQSLYEQFKQNKTNENLTHLVEAIVKTKPELGSSEKMINAIKHYIIIRAMFEWLKEYHPARLAYEIYKENPLSKHYFKKMILENHPQIREIDSFNTDKILENLLLDKVNWEKRNPNKIYSPEYISPRTDFYSKCAANELMHRHTPPLPMPTFGKVVGFKSLYPPYLIDAAGTLLFENPAKAICLGINKLCGSYKTSWWAGGLKALLAGPFIAAKVCTFCIAKILSPSGIKEIAHSISTKKSTARSEIELIEIPPTHITAKKSKKTNELKLDNDILPGQTLTSDSRIFKKMNTSNSHLPRLTSDIKCEEFVSDTKETKNENKPISPSSSEGETQKVSTKNRFKV